MGKRRKSGSKWKTNKCGRCGKPHDGYSGKIDSFGNEYVVCGYTNKKIVVQGDLSNSNTFAFPTTWVKE